MIYVVQNSRVAELLKVSGITLYPFIFIICSYEKACGGHLMAHEWIHIKQVRKHGWLKFYISYLWYFFKARRKGLDQFQAYMAIPYEKEAYENQRLQAVPKSGIKVIG